ncbi:MAG: hypothetical protein HYR96_04995 [Deltaproteobacteria bacterium]|nr:hypothetical protein [Deltaproteobacteria bacterium]
MAQGIHYLDITGELAVFETAHGKGDRARERGLVLMPGVGFDVVPTDCLALSLKERMPDATHLELAFFAKSPPSVGTVKTMLENIPKGGCERVNGRLVPVPMFHKVKRVKFRTRELDCAAIPWGDLATAFYSTGIPNIVVYSVHPPGFVALSKLVNPVKGLMGLAPVQRLLKAGVQRLIRGPSPEQQANSTIEIWGRVSGPTGELEDRIEVCEGYRFTAEVALECVKRVLAMELKGYFTPAQAFGSGLLRETGHLL